MLTYIHSSYTHSHTLITYTHTHNESNNNNKEDWGTQFIRKYNVKIPITNLIW